MPRKGEEEDEFKYQTVNGHLLCAWPGDTNMWPRGRKWQNKQ